MIRVTGLLIALHSGLPEQWLLFRHDCAQIPARQAPKGVILRIDTAQGKLLGESD